MHCDKVPFPEFLDCFDGDLEYNIENNAWSWNIMQKNYRKFLNKLCKEL